MTDQIKLPIENFPAQQSIFDSPALYKVVAKGRRFGLTRGAANDFILSALEHKFTKGLWVDVVNSNIDRYVQRYFIPALSKLPHHLWNWQKQQKILYIDKSYIDFRSADTPENIEGFGYDKAFLNEAGIILKNEYLWNNAIRPMLWDNPCVTVIGGTPKGKGKFFELAQRGQDPTQEKYQYFHFSTFDNPFIPTDEIRKDIEDLPQNVIDQEIYAKFLDDTGVVFRGIQEIAKAEFKEPLPGHFYVMGVDLAKVQDFTVIAVYDRGNNRQVYQARFNKMDWAVQKARIAQTAEHYNHATVVVDSTGVGEPIYEDLARSSVAVIPYKFTNESKKQLIEKLATYIELKRISILPIEDTLHEFTNFTYDISSTGKIRYEAPAGFHDDIVIAHGLAIWELSPQYKSNPDDKPLSAIQRAYARDMSGMSDYNQSQNEFDDWSRG